MSTIWKPFLRSRFTVLGSAIVIFLGPNTSSRSASNASVYSKQKIGLLFGVWSILTTLCPFSIRTFATSYEKIFFSSIDSPFNPSYFLYKRLTPLEVFCFLLRNNAYSSCTCEASAHASENLGHASTLPLL